MHLTLPSGLKATALHGALCTVVNTARYAGAWALAFSSSGDWSISSSCVSVSMAVSRFGSVCMKVYIGTVASPEENGERCLARFAPV